MTENESSCDSVCYRKCFIQYKKQLYILTVITAKSDFFMINVAPCLDYGFCAAVCSAGAAQTRHPGRLLGFPHTESCHLKSIENIVM